MSCVKQDFKGRIDQSHVGKICNQINPNWVDSSKCTRAGRGKEEQFVESTLQEDLTERQKQVLEAHDDAFTLIY
jgi:hypothetical protein